MPAKYTALQIAEWFLAYNRLNMSERGGDTISNLKLQKLLYYAQGACLGILGKPLFDDLIKAWKHGPVVESVYHKYKEFGNRGIEFEDEYDNSVVDSVIEDILIQVYNVFGQYSAWKLANMTHEEAPWSETASRDIISTEKIQKYFIENYIGDADE